MKTYILRCQDWYKIGKTSNLKRRLLDYDTHNPDYELIYLMNFDCEQFLHVHFANKRHKLEWYNLDKEDINWIINNQELLSKNTFEILKAQREEENRLYEEEYKRIKLEKKRIKKEQDILKRNLEDKEQEAWLLKKIAECPTCFS